MLNQNELIIETYREEGYDGETKTNKSGVRIIHFPTGWTVECKDEKSQIKNKEKCLKKLEQILEGGAI